MRFEDLLRRVAIGGEGVDRRLVWRIVAGVLLLYAASFAVFYPRVATNDDEAQYIRQARLLMRGTTHVVRVDPLSGEVQRYRPSSYPVGTALSLAPFTLLGDSRGVFLGPLLFLLAAIGLTGVWIEREGRSPIFALLVFGFPATLVLGRVPLSEAPSLLLVSLGLLLFWRGLERGGWPWLASGFVAGASMMWREPNVLVFAPFFAGAVLRREWRCWALVVGGGLGVGVRLLASYLAFGDPLFVKALYKFTPGTIDERLPLYLLGLLVFVPGGLVFSLLYRGRRAPELRGSVLLLFFFYLFQKHGMIETAFAKRIVTALRYFVPLLPVMAFAMAESVPHLWERLGSGLPPARRERLQAWGSGLLVAWIAGIAVAGVAVHWAFDRWSATQFALRDAIHRHTGDGSVLVTNLYSTRKFLRDIDRHYAPLNRDAVSPDEVAQLLQGHDELFLVFLDRSDSEYHRGDAERNAAFVASLSPPPRLEFDQQVSATDRLRIWRVTRLERAPPGQSARTR